MNQDVQVIKVICLKWGTKYASNDVNKLFKMVEKNLSLNFDFYCITENAEDLDSRIKILPLLDSSLEGWWHKLTLFQKDFHGLKGTALFLDLDIVITNPIDELFSYLPGETLAAKDFGKCRWGHLNSSVVRFEIGSLDFVWQGFLYNKEWIIKNMNGDQDWLGRVAPSIKLFPSEWVVSFKKHCQSEAPNYFGIGHKLIRRGWIKPHGEAVLPREAKIVLFHGKPDPDDVAVKPYRRWKRASWILDYRPED